MRYVGALACVGLMLAVTATAGATGIYGISNDLGYQGTIRNVTQGTGPWATSTPRDANLYFVSGVPSVYSDWNQLGSTWAAHSPSNQNDSFLQLAEPATSVTSATGQWDLSLKVFSLTVTGANAPYPYSRMWQPDNGVAWGVTFTNYTYSFTATFPDAATAYLDGYANGDTATSIVGNFSGQFQVTYDVNKNPITNGDIYAFSINFGTALFAPFDSDGGPIYGPITNGSYFFGAAPEYESTIPEPLTMAGLAMGIGGLVTYIRKRRKA